MMVVDISILTYDEHIEMMSWLIKEYGYGADNLERLNYSRKYKWARELINNRIKLSFANEEIYTRFMLTWM